MSYGSCAKKGVFWEKQYGNGKTPLLKCYHNMISVCPIRNFFGHFHMFHYGLSQM